MEYGTVHDGSVVALYVSILRLFLWPTCSYLTLALFCLRGCSGNESLVSYGWTYDATDCINVILLLSGARSWMLFKMDVLVLHNFHIYDKWNICRVGFGVIINCSCKIPIFDVKYRKQSSSTSLQYLQLYTNANAPPSRNQVFHKDNLNHCKYRGADDSISGSV